MCIKIVLNLLYISSVLTLNKTKDHHACDESDKNKIDSTYAKLLVLGRYGRNFPENKQGELKLFCDKTTEYITEADSYKDKCLKQMPKQVTAVFIYSVRNYLRQYCKKDSKKLTLLIEAAPCINSGKKESEHCFVKLIDRFLGARNAPEKMRIPHICCDYFKFMQCFLDLPIEKFPRCNEKHIETAESFFRGLSGNIVDLICGDYTEGSDKCEKMAKTPGKKRNQKRTKSFMLPLVDALASIED